MLNKRSDKVELLRIAEAVALEKSINKEIILSTMESAIQKAAKTRFGFENDIRASGQIYNVTDGIAYSSRDIYEAMCRIIGKKIPKWSVPLIFFKIVSKISFGKLNKINKLFEDECYSSEKIRSLGFKPKKSIGEMNETFF